MVGARRRRSRRKTYELTDFLVSVLEARARAGHVRRHDHLSRLAAPACARWASRRSRARLLGQDGRACGSRRWPNARRAAASAARSRSSSARSRRASPTTSASTSSTNGAEAVVLGDLGCMLNIEGRLRRRGDATRVLHVAEVLAGELPRAPDRTGSHASRVDVLQGARARQAARRAAPAQPDEDQGQVRREARGRADRARRLRRHARGGARRFASARSTTSTSGSTIFERERARARRDGAVRADAGRHQRARARDRAPARRAQDHQVEVDGVGGVGARPRDRGAPG